MKLAIIGTGISGLTCAHLLHPSHDITIFEAADWIGGHTHTVDATGEDGTQAVDTGFIVFNDWTYPNFIKLLERLKVETQPTSMSFSVKHSDKDFEYNGTSLNALFAQRSNLLSPGFYRMVKDILRFNREALKVLDEPELAYMPLGKYLKENRYSREFRDYYILPMGAAIWSASVDDFRKTPMRFFVQFFKNHGMLNVNDRPQWRTIKGGSREYVKKLIQPFEDRIYTNTPIQTVTRDEGSVTLTTRNGEKHGFDGVIIAVHSDQALRMLEKPTVDESKILNAIPYQENSTVLHRDIKLLPKREIARASWNYHLSQKKKDQTTVTYYMNILQNLHSRDHWCVSLNVSDQINKDLEAGCWNYAHPQFTRKAVQAQKYKSRINGKNRTWYCGAYWGYGFHEDGVKSALDVTKEFGVSL